MAQIGAERRVDLVDAAEGMRAERDEAQFLEHRARPAGIAPGQEADSPYAPRKPGRLGVHQARRHLREERRRTLFQRGDPVADQVLRPQIEYLQSAADALEAFLGAPGLRLRIGRRGDLARLLPGGFGDALVEPFADPLGLFHRRNRLLDRAQKKPERVLARELAARARAPGAEVAPRDTHLVFSAALALAPDRGLARTEPAPHARRGQLARGLGDGRVGRERENLFDGQRQDWVS